MRSFVERSTASPDRKRRGFTLVETLVAIAVASIGLLTVFTIFPAGYASGGKSQARAQAVAIATDIIASFRTILSGGPAAYPANANGTTSPYFGYYINQFGPLPSTTIGNSSFSNTYSGPLYNVGAEVSSSVLSSFYYAIFLDEVVDPEYKILGIGYPGSSSIIGYGTAGTNYPASWTNSPKYWPDVVGMRRITVYVEGPFSNTTDLTTFNANNGVATSKSSAVRVVLASYISSPRMGPYANVQATLAYAVGAGTYPISADGFPHGNRLYITTSAYAANPTDPYNDPRNGFWAYSTERLSPYEINDTGPISTVDYNTQEPMGRDLYPAPPADNYVYSSSLYNGVTTASSSMQDSGEFISGLNELRMDNVWIGDVATGGGASTTSIAHDYCYDFLNDPKGSSLNQLGEGNKIVDMGYDSTAGAFYLDCLHSIRGWDSSGSGTTASYSAYPVGTYITLTMGTQYYP